jgi:ArsR family transcriptional regulator, zinc-responsive transcriptional repressor
MKQKKSIHLPMEVLIKASECLKTLAHPVRLRMVELLLEEQYTVGELAKVCEVAPNVASEHLRHMQHCGIMKSHREGRQVFYSLTDEMFRSLLLMIEKKFTSKEST